MQQIKENLHDGGDIEAKAAAWSVVYTWLSEHGLNEWRNAQPTNLCGIETAIGFLEHKFSSSNVNA